MLMRDTFLLFKNFSSKKRNIASLNSVHGSEGFKLKFRKKMFIVTMNGQYGRPVLTFGQRP